MYVIICQLRKSRVLLFFLCNVRNDTMKCQQTKNIMLSLADKKIMMPSEQEKR